MASLLPGDADRSRFLHALGIHGDPVTTKRRIDRAKRTGENLGLDPYGYKRAFLYHPTSDEEEWLRYEARRAEVVAPVVLDPTAGGGSIPFEAARSGVSTSANDLNPVAGLIMQALLTLRAIWFGS
jgi:adenine-specific DNA methylase